jgi:proline utilization trans-activator
MTIALSEACIYAARATNRLMGQLWADGLVATFGFFDAHYIFSATTVQLMSHALNPTAHDRDAVGLAWALLRSMVDDGNMPAREFAERLVALQKDLDGLGREGDDVADEGKTETGSRTGAKMRNSKESVMMAVRPEKGYVAGAGTFAAPVGPVGNAVIGPGMRGLGNGTGAGNGSCEGGGGLDSNRITANGEAWSLPAGMGMGIETCSSAPLDDPFISDFLGQPDTDWSPDALDMSNDDEIGTWSLAWDTGHLFQENSH